MSRLPTPGQDDGTWGDILNDFLSVSHNPDGTLSANTVSSTQVQTGSLPALKLDTTTQTNLTKASTSVQQVNSILPNGSGAVTLTAADVSAIATSAKGAANGVATLDGSSKVPVAQIPDLSGSYVSQKFHNTPDPFNGFGQYSSGRVACGIDPVHGKVWSYNSGGLYQVDALTSAAWTALTLPANVSPSGQAAKVVVSGTTMYLISWNTTTSRYECYSAPEGLKSVAPTWSSLLFSYAANAALIPTAIHVLSDGTLLAGEYSGTLDISGGPTIHRYSGGTHTTPLQIAGARHIHGIYEDPLNPGTVYATIGDFFSPYTPPAALYKSTDFGATWTGITALQQPWQAVSLGFDANWIWACSDQSQGGGPYILDRATLTPKWACGKRHDRLAVPGGAGARYLTDVGLTSGSTTLTSAAAVFTTTDVGRYVGGHNGIALGTYIASVTNATTMVLSQAATTTGTNQSVVIAGDMYYANAYTGATDPATGYLYIVANDASNSGNVGGLFVVRAPGTDPELLWTIFNASGIGNHELYIGGGYLWFDRYGPMPLLTVA